MPKEGTRKVVSHRVWGSIMGRFDILRRHRPRTSPSKPFRFPRIQVSFKAKVKKHDMIVPGNAFNLSGSPKLHVGLAWDMLNSYTGSGIPIDLDVSCVAVTKVGQISLLDSVYYGNLSNPSQSIVHSGDETTGLKGGDDEHITLDLSQIPDTIRAMYIILIVATRDRTFKDVDSAFLRVLNAYNNNTICCFTALSYPP